MLKILFTRKFVIMLIIGLSCVFCYRSFCRFICPLGAIYGIFNKLALVSVKVDENRCNSCGACVRNCQMDVRHVGDHECINCARCMSSCSQNALSLKCGTHTIIAPACGCADDKPDSAEKRSKYGRIARGAALAVLCFALVWFNFLDPSVRKAGAQAADQQTADAGDAYASTAPVGTAIGEQLADFSAELIDGSTFHLADQRGKVVIINMWATYCGPCVQELPIFQDFQKAHEEDAAMLIIHASDPLEEIPEFLEKKSITLPCAIDSMDDYLYNLCGASPSILPHTVILNRRGEIVYNQTGSMSEALLDELFEKAK
jgi:thiol-disulfide isomerase/thioredoxin/Fe-S-cluster-containing hydrogenase component 2